MSSSCLNKTSHVIEKVDPWGFVPDRLNGTEGDGSGSIRRDVIDPYLLFISSPTHTVQEGFSVKTKPTNQSWWWRDKVR